MKSTTSHCARRGILRGASLLAAVVLGSAGAAYGQFNLLQNPGAESGFSGWNTYNNVGYNFGTPGNQAPPRTGAACFWMFGDYNTSATVISNGMTQTVAASPGEVLTADGYAYTESGDSVGQAGNHAFLEVTYRDVNNAVLARYRSVDATNGFPTDTWTEMQVTNQWSIDGSTLLGHVTTLVAPAGTTAAQMNVAFVLVNGGGGSMYWDDMALDSTVPPPTIADVSVPNNELMATNRVLTFTAQNSPANITNVQLAVTATALGGFASTTTYGPGSSGVSITGLGTHSAAASFPLSSNTIYSITITAGDDNGFVSKSSLGFDTVQPVLVWEAEDYNFGGGQWTATPADGGVNLYAGDASIDGVDSFKPGGCANNCNGNDHQYRPSDLVGIDIATEENAFRAKFGSASDYDIGYAGPGDWENYTRNFPAGSYNVYARYAVSGTAKVNLGLVSGNTATTNQSVTNLGVFTVTGGDWNQYFYVPLEDQFGNIAPVTLGGTETLRATQTVNPAANQNFYFIVPAQPLSNPNITGLNPTGTHPFEQTNKLSFTVTPGAGPAITTDEIHVLLNGSDVTGQASFTAASNTWQVNVPLAKDTLYTAYIAVTNSSHLPAFKTIKFDTFSESYYMWEGEDYDFNGGQFIDNPVPSADNSTSGTGTGLCTGELATNSYYGEPGSTETTLSGATAIQGIDAGVGTDSGETFNYRLDSDAQPGAQPASDYIRQKFLAAQTLFGDPNITDFNIGYFNPSWWLNYTRHYPAGSYHIYGRLATASPYTGCVFSIVTNGWGTVNQQTNVLGTFSDPNASGYQSWDWVPLEDAQNNLVTVTFNGNTNTLKITSTGLNVNYFMLVPVGASPLSVSLTGSVVGNQVHISFPTQANHTYTVESSSTLTSGSWTTNTVITGDGSVKTATDTLGASGTQRFYRVAAQ
ncbi:MAG TPA: hypothetical protein VHB20_03660 [Verrucomicrobiae bacterium]|jgi:hypothetical protein|nr:hypothetical protein [Verrucomicrobiae bacterium]